MSRARSSVSKVHAKPAIEALESRVLMAKVTAGFTDSVYVGGLTRPTAMTFAPDGRLCVSSGWQGRRHQERPIASHAGADAQRQQGWRARRAGQRLRSGLRAESLFLSLLHRATPAHNRLSRFTVTGDTIDPTSEKVLLDLPPLNAVYHNSGTLHFGADGKLYVSVGDNVQGAVAQSMTSLFGKILRINPDGTIPTDNPFYNTATGDFRLIYDLGLRNPFTFAIEQGTNRLFINDVGDASFEEVDRDSGHGGNNFGWPIFEGPGPAGHDPKYTDPLYYYPHNPGTAVVGGVFYPTSGGTFPKGYDGTYIFADHEDGLIQALDPNTGKIVGVISNGDLTANADLDIGPDGRALLS